MIYFANNLAENILIFSEISYKLKYNKLLLYKSYTREIIDRSGLKKYK